MAKPMTHKAKYKRFVDFKEIKEFDVKVRELKECWVDSNNTKYQKKDGVEVSNSFCPKRTLILSTIKEI